MFSKRSDLFFFLLISGTFASASLLYGARYVSVQQSYSVKEIDLKVHKLTTNFEGLDILNMILLYIVWHTFLHRLANVERMIGNM